MVTPNTDPSPNSTPPGSLPPIGPSGSEIFARSPSERILSDDNGHDELVSAHFGVAIPIARKITTSPRAGSFSRTELEAAIEAKLESDGEAVHDHLLNSEKFEKVIDRHTPNSSQVNALLYENTPLEVVLDTTHDVLSLPALCSRLLPPHSITGRLVLIRSLRQLSEPLEIIQSKHEALRELSSNPTLAKALREYAKEFGKGEGFIYNWIYNHRWEGFHHIFNQLQKNIQFIHEGLKAIPKVQSVYLTQLLGEIDSFKDSRTYKLFTEGMVRTFRGLRLPNEVGIEPHYNFHPWGHWKPATITGLCLFGVSATLALTQSMSQAGVVSGVCGFGLAALGSFVVGLASKEFNDYVAVAKQLSWTMQSDPKFRRTLAAIGRLNEILGFHRFSVTSKLPTCLPQLTDGDVHYFKAQDMGHPLFVGDPNFVLNDVDLSERGLLFVTGPNSGGKTTFCQAIPLNQILAEMGCYVVARQCELNRASDIGYQVPRFDPNTGVTKADGSEGRFGTELKETKNMTLCATPKSLRIFDELSEGTTTIEKQFMAEQILELWAILQGTTILVTHNYEIADNFQERGIGHACQVEWGEEEPTHKIIPGVSRTSHAKAVADRVGFGVDAMRRLLRKRGIVPKP